MIEHKEKKYARVSEVLAQFSDYGHIDPHILANKARIGTEVHKAINDEINDEFPIYGDDCKGYFESYLLWKERFKPKFQSTEERFFDDRLMICGQIDALVVIGENKPCLLDFKTSVKENFVTWPMQAHLYYHLLKHNKVECSSEFYFLKLNKYGTNPVMFTYEFDEGILSKCFKAIDTFWEKHKIDTE